MNWKHISLKPLIIGIVLILISFEGASAQDPFKMAIFPRRPDAQTFKAFTPLAEYLSQKISKEVKLVVFQDFSSFWNGLKLNQYDLVHFNQYHYIKSHSELGYKVILINEEFGFSSIRSVIITRGDSKINKISDLKGQKILFGGGKGAMVAYIGATQILRNHGLKEGDYTEDFAKNPAGVPLAVYNRMVKAGGSGDILFHVPLFRKRISTEGLKILAIGEELPMLCWAVRDGMDIQMVEKIKAAMIGLKEDQSEREILKSAYVTGFHSAENEQFDHIREIVRDVLNEDYR